MPTPAAFPPVPAIGRVRTDVPALAGRSVAVLVAPGIDAAQVEAVQIAVRRDGGRVDVVAPSLAALETPRGSTLMPDGTFTTRSPLDYDAVVVPGGDTAGLRGDGAAVAFVARAYLHALPIGLLGDGADMLRGVPMGEGGIVQADTPGPAFINALKAGVAARVPHDALPGPGLEPPPPDAPLHGIAG